MLKEPGGVRSAGLESGGLRNLLGGLYACGDGKPADGPASRVVHNVAVPLGALFSAKGIAYRPSPFVNSQDRLGFSEVRRISLHIRLCGGESEIRTRQALLESVSCKFHKGVKSAKY